MQLVKDKEIIDDNWRFVSDEEDLGIGDITVTLQRWNNDQNNLLAHQGKVGVRLSAADVVEEITGDLKNIHLVELDFADFADGRLFSHAWLLRSRFDYLEEIRAIGHYLLDQVFYLSRVGVNAFSIQKASDLTQVLTNLNDFTVQYQRSIN